MVKKEFTSSGFIESSCKVMVGQMGYSQYSMSASYSWKSSALKNSDIKAGNGGDFVLQKKRFSCSRRNKITENARNIFLFIFPDVWGGYIKSQRNCVCDINNFICSKEYVGPNETISTFWGIYFAISLLPPGFLHSPSWCCQPRSRRERIWKLLLCQGTAEELLCPKLICFQLAFLMEIVAFCKWNCTCLTEGVIFKPISLIYGGNHALVPLCNSLFVLN